MKKRATALATPRPKRKRAASAKPADLRHLIRTVERKLQAEITGLRDELRASETALAAARLRALNEGQAREGVERLRADLKAFRGLGIVDKDGKRVHRELPAEMLEDATDVV
jgi:hypothetical protein